MTKQDIEQITEIVHNTIFQFFDVCGDNEEVPISEKDKLLLRVNKAVCKGIRELEQVDEPVVKSESVDETVDAISRQAVLDTIGKMTCPCGDGTSIYDEGNFIHNETLSDVHQAVLDLPSRHGREDGALDRYRKWSRMF